MGEYITRLETDLRSSRLALMHAEVRARACSWGPNLSCAPRYLQWRAATPGKLCSHAESLPQERSSLEVLNTRGHLWCEISPPADLISQLLNAVSSEDSAHVGSTRPMAPLPSQWLQRVPSPQISPQERFVPLLLFDSQA